MSSTCMQSSRSLHVPIEAILQPRVIIRDETIQESEVREDTCMNQARSPTGKKNLNYNDRCSRVAPLRYTLPEGGRNRISIDYEQECSPATSQMTAPSHLYLLLVGPTTTGSYLRQRWMEPAIWDRDKSLREDCEGAWDVDRLLTGGTKVVEQFRFNRKTEPSHPSPEDVRPED